MAKRSNNKPSGKNKNKPARSRTGSGKTRIMDTQLVRLDAAALAYRRLLLDPCNAPLVAPPYAGFGSGSYLRVKSTIVAAALSTDGVFVFQPGTNLWWSGATNTAGNSIPMSAAGPIYNIAGVNQLRALAACVKVRYTGAEGSRAGTIGLMVGTPHYMPAGSATAVGGLNVCPFVSRFGETAHEVKWMPSAADEEFHDSSLAFFQPRSSCLTIIIQGVTPGSVQVEITTAYEVEGTTVNSTPMVATSPPSSNTTNHILRSLGDYTMWAFSNVAVPVLKATAHAGVAMYTRGAYARVVNQNRIGMM